VATRLNINVNDETAAALQELAAKRDTTLTEIVRRAVSVYKFVEDEVVDGEKTLEIKDKTSGERTTLAVL
jgi:predicted transcriptional regulator